MRRQQPLTLPRAVSLRSRRSEQLWADHYDPMPVARQAAWAAAVLPRAILCQRISVAFGTKRKLTHPYQPSRIYDRAARRRGSTDLPLIPSHHQKQKTPLGSSDSYTRGNPRSDDVMGLGGPLYNRAEPISTKFADNTPKPDVVAGNGRKYDVNVGNCCTVPTYLGVVSVGSLIFQ
jgi:hypothetical protein